MPEKKSNKVLEPHSSWYIAKQYVKHSMVSDSINYPISQGVFSEWKAGNHINF